MATRSCIRYTSEGIYKQFVPKISKSVFKGHIDCYRIRFSYSTGVAYLCCVCGWIPLLFGRNSYNLAVGVAIPQKAHVILHELLAWTSHEILLMAMLQQWEFTNSSWSISWETHTNFSWDWKERYVAWCQLRATTKLYSLPMKNCWSRSSSNLMDS